MDAGIPIIILVAVGMIFVFWNGLKNKQKSKEDERANYKDFWTKSGVSGKWWILALNLVGNLILLKEVFTIRSLTGAALAQWQVGVGFTYMLWVMWPSLPVIICLGFFFRFELCRNNIKQKWPYAFFAVASVVGPLVLVANIGKIIKG